MGCVIIGAMGAGGGATTGDEYDDIDKCLGAV